MADRYVGDIEVPTDMYSHIDEAEDHTTEQSRYEADGIRYTADRTDGYYIIRDHKQRVWICPDDIIHQLVYMMNDFERTHGER